ncbi:class I SAM-dependent methyltransferase [Desnuesiella massiliensis]|uniref:class I SAM-dependent methyltransferase n=1 Tax=Desnuesiella massiliensis TaxID=1650662 RepID=UPI0006E410D6|nr:class I SAM-dependent methyltransferase [Desnuesiella massiliensis]
MLTIDVINRWYADLYDQEEIQIDDVNFMLSVIGEASKNILEVCCGSGRILVPLAKAGHKVTGFDMDNYMLERISPKAKGLTNINFSKADAINDDWGNNFDTVVLAGNILINIISSMNYKEAQKLFIKRSYDALKLNGHIYLDFDCFPHPENFFGNSDERIIFEGVDSLGSYGKIIISDGKYEPQTQITTFKRKTEIISKDGEKIVRESVGAKHIPTLLQVHEWLDQVGFKIVSEYGDYNGNPISETTHRAIIWAEKNK